MPTRSLTLAALSFCYVATALAQSPPDFQGRYIAAISDADMRAYAYIDGDLGPPRGQDQLAIVALPLRGQQPTGVAEVSNSVINPVYSIAASADGNTIFVAETATQREPDDKTIRDLQPGTTLRAIDVSDPAAPKIIDSVEVGIRPLGVSLSPDGRTMVLATEAPGTPLTFVTFADGRFGPAQQFALQGLSPMPDRIDQGLQPQHAEWHPNEDVIAVNLHLRGQGQFYRVARAADGSVEGLSLWGNPAVTSKWPMSGKFSRDGRFYVTNDLQWGPDVEGFYVNAPPSQLTVIRLAELAAEEPRHFVVGGVSLPRHAESIAFSNDGATIATLNIGQTWIPEGGVGHSFSSISLIAFDPESGQPTHAGNWEINGILPEGIAFDASDSYVVAGIYEYEGPEPRRSALEFWRVVREQGRLPRLVPTGFAVETGPGAHSLVVVN